MDTTLTSDVNEQFFEQRTATIARGDMARRDDGTWVSTVDRAEVLGRDGLDMTLGSAALYTTTPAWHGLGTVVPGGTASVERVLELGGIGFGVELVPAEYTWHDTRLVHADRFHTVRDDTGDPLGVVGRVYQPIQNREAFAFLEDLVGTYRVTWESAGALRGGRRVFVSMRLPDTVTVDADGINDEIVPFVVALNSHDGSSPFQVVVTPWRPVCANTERLAVQDAYTRWTVRHTIGALDRLAEARRTLGLSAAYYQQFAAEETALARTELEIAEFHQVIGDLWPVDADATARTKSKAEARTQLLRDRFDTETERVGRSAYAAERAVTTYLDWLAPIRPSAAFGGDLDLARGTRLLEGTDDETKTKAHRRLMRLTT